jgi:hypothetical protein
LSEAPAWAIVLLWCLALGLVLYVLNLALATGTPRSPLRGGGAASGLTGRLIDAAGQGMLNAQAVVEPEKRHLKERKGEARPQEDDEAGPA